MRSVNGFFCVLLTLFALVQYNDPDAALWILIYAVPAAWAGAVAFRRDLPAPCRRTITAYMLCLAAAILGSLYLLPSLPENWIEVEEEREGLGVIIATVALTLAGIAWWHGMRRQSRSAS